MLSPRSLFECAYIGFNKNMIAAIHTDGLWSFPIDLDEGLRDCQKYTTAEVIKMIEVLSPDVMVQHIVDETRHRYSALFEILSIPFIGSDSQVSANIVDKGTRPQTHNFIQVCTLTTGSCFNFSFREVQ